MPVDEPNNGQWQESVPLDPAGGMGGAPEANSPDDVVDPGAVLRSARLAAGISIEQMAQRLRLMGRVVEAIEANDLHQFSAPVYLRGYIRNYAKLLGIDPAPLLRAYGQQPTGAIPGPPTNRGNEANDEGSSVRGGGPWRPSALLIGVFVALALLLAWQWSAVEEALHGYRENLASQSATGSIATRRTGEGAASPQLPESAASERSVATRDATVPPVSESMASEPVETVSTWPTRGATSPPEGAGADLDVMSGGEGLFDSTALQDRRDGLPEAQANANATATPGEALGTMEFAGDGLGDQTAPTITDATEFAGIATELPDSLPATEQTPIAADVQPGTALAAEDPDPSAVPRDLLRVRRITPTGDDELWFEFTEDCWVEIYNTDGRSLYQDLSQRRQSLRLVGRGPFQIQLGYAPGVTLEYNGEPVPLAPHTRNTVASLVVGQ